MKSERSVRSIGTTHAGMPELVYHELREAILSGVYQAGQMLRQEALAKHLGVSRAPLREALPRLEADGLVVSHPRRGYAVVSLNPEDIIEIFELRALVEERAVRVSVERRTDDDIAKLRALSKQMREVGERMKSIQPKRWEEGVVRWSNLNTQFHDRLIAPSERKRFLRLAGQLRREAGMYVRTEIGLTDEVVEAQNEHDLIVEAFAKGDADRVGRLSREHCEHTAQRLLTGLKRMSSDGENDKNTNVL